MDTLAAIQERRSVKQYDPAFEMPEADVEKLMDLALLSPTSFNIQNWRFVVVRDDELKAQIRAASWNQAQVTDSCLTILLCGDPMAWDKDPGRYWRNAPEATQKVLVPMIGQMYTAAGETVQRDEVMRSVGIAGQTIMLAAKAMGYDTCPMIGFDPVKVGELINLPEGHLAALMITVGKAAQPAHPRGGQLDKSEVVFTDRYPDGAS